MARVEAEVARFEEGFSGKSVLGALFIGFIMMPGAIYLGMLAGQSIAPAAQWVTIILFVEVTRRSFAILRRQEIYILFYIAGAVSAMNAPPFSSLIWNQYLVQSPQAEAFGITHDIPSWVAPTPGTPGFEAIVRRTFFHPAWLAPIGLLLIGQVLGRLQWVGLGYTMFRITSDVERLPFPMAPVAAMGATALAEVFEEETTWRWRVFSMAAVGGMVWGFVYAGVPIITSVMLAKPLQAIPLPFIDSTITTESFLPAASTGIALDMGSLLMGFILPFPIVMGVFTSSILTQLISPILYKYGFLKIWHPGMPAIPTNIATQFDVWLSVGIGALLAVGFVGVGAVIAAFIRERAGRAGKERAIYAVPPGRGDFPILLAIGLWAISTIGYLVLCHKLVPRFPLWVLMFWGLLYSPFNSYVSARMYGFAGQGLGFPYVREGIFILSGYKGVDIWFAPVPIYDVGWAAQMFREVELVGCKITSVIKAELLMFPILLTCSFIFWAFFWRIGPIPSAAYPFIQKMWPINATFQCLWASSTKPGVKVEEIYLMKALKLPLIGYSTAAGLALYGIIAALGIPSLWFYGLCFGVGQMPHGIILQFVGALLGRYYFAKKFGAEKWRNYTPVLMAGFACGMGLISMVTVAITLVYKSVSYLPF